MGQDGEIKANALFVLLENSGGRDHGDRQVWLGTPSLTSYQQSRPRWVSQNRAVAQGDQLGAL